MLPYRVIADYELAAGIYSLYKMIQVQNKQFIVLGGRPLATIKDWIFNAYFNVNNMDKLHF